MFLMKFCQKRQMKICFHDCYYLLFSSVIINSYLINFLAIWNLFLACEKLIKIV